MPTNEEIAKQLAGACLHTANIPTSFSFTVYDGNVPQGEIVIDVRYVPRDKHLFEKRGGWISMGPSGNPCPTCGGSGRV